MSDRMEAGARRTISHTLKSGKTITLSTIGYRDIASAREQAVRHYKRQWLQTWTENIDLVPEDIRERKLDEAFSKAAAMSLEDLPIKMIKLPRRGEDGQILTNGDGLPILTNIPADYTSWWASQTDEGRTFNIWQSMRYDPAQASISLQAVRDMFADEIDLESAAQVAGEVSESQFSGNSEAPPSEGRKRKRSRRSTGR